MKWRNHSARGRRMRDDRADDFGRCTKSCCFSHENDFCMDRMDQMTLHNSISTPAMLTEHHCFDSPSPFNWISFATTNRRSIKVVGYIYEDASIDALTRPSQQQRGTKQNHEEIDFRHITCASTLNDKSYVLVPSPTGESHGQFHSLFYG